MKVFTAAVAAAVSCSVGAVVAEMLDGPEVADVLLPEVAHVFGVNYVSHSTFEDLKLRPEDVHVLPKAPNVEDSLGALSGAPLTRQPKPFAHAVLMLDVNNYNAAQIKVAEARAAELVASLAPKVEYVPRLRASSQVSLVPIDIAPGQYGNVPYVIFNFAIYGILLPLALCGLRHAKNPQFIKKLLPAAAFFLAHNVSSIIIQNVLSYRGVLAVPIAACFGILAMLYAFRRADSLSVWNTAMTTCPCFTGMDKEPVGYCACERIFMLVVANLTYHGISSVLPYRLGLAGFATSNVMIAGLIYFSYLLIVGTYIRQRLCESGDATKNQRIVFSLVCSYIAISAISFFVDIVAVYFGIGDFIAFDPPVFFSTATVYELNLGTILATLAFLGMWGASYQELKAMEEQQKAVASTSALAVPTFEESSSALSSTLAELKTSGIIM